MILERGGDCLFALMGTHPLLAAEVAGRFADLVVKQKLYQMVDADHGQIGTRINRDSPDVEWLFLRPDRG